MRILGIIFFGFLSICAGVSLIIFCTLYFTLSDTSHLFREYEKNGVYSKISNSIQGQIINASNGDSAEAGTAEQNDFEKQMQLKVSEIFFSEKNIQKTVENNMLRFKEFQNSDQKQFTPYVPFTEKDGTDNFIEELGLGEMKNDPELQKMFSEIPSKMTGDEGTVKSISDGAQSLKNTLKILKYLLPAIFAISILIVLLLTRGIGKLRSLGILLVITALCTWGIFVINKLIITSTIQNSAFISQNLGTQIASLILNPIAAIGLSLMMRVAIFVSLAGILFIVAWLVVKMSSKKSPPKQPVSKKSS